MKGRTQESVSRARRQLVLHPILFAIFPVIFLWSNNVAEMSAAGSNSDVLLPLLVSVAFAVMAWVSLSLVFLNPRKAGLVVTVFLLLFFSFGYIHSTITDLGLYYLKLRYLLLIWIGLLIVGSYVSLSPRFYSQDVTSYLNIIGIILVLIPAASLGVYALTPKPTSASYAVGPNAKASPGIGNSSAFPDIYYIILDGYAGSPTLSKVLDYDNSDFLSYLRQQGFYVADQSWSNFSSTLPSLASSLNMEYVNYLEDQAREDYFDSGPYVQLIRRSIVIDFLSSNDYKIIHFRDEWMPRAGRVANFQSVSCTPGSLLSLGRGEYMEALIETTLLKPFKRYIGVVEDHHRQMVLCEFARFSEVDNIQGPKFVLAHLSVPHPPYVFDRDGQEIVTTSSAREWNPKEQYLDQLVFTNGKVKEILTSLTSRSSHLPIILLQADHGPAFVKNDLNRNAVQSSMSILNAYFLPGGNTAGLYESITPVNSFRLVFNQYFGADYELLEDKSYYTFFDQGRYNFADVTDGFR